MVLWFHTLTILRRFYNMFKCDIAHTPMNSNLRFIKTKENCVSQYKYS